MQIVEASSKGLNHTFKITLPAQNIVDAVNAKIAAYGQNIQLPGFRKGKVPTALLKQRYGNSVATEVLEEKVQELVEATLKEKNIKPALRPEVSLDPFSLGQDLVVTMRVEALPVLKEVSVKDFPLEKLVAPVAKEDIEKAIKNLAVRNKIPVALEKDRATQKEDFLKISYTLKEKGKTIEERKDASYIVGTKVFGEAFDDALIGMKKGDKKEIETILPEMFFGKKLGGKKCTVEVAIDNIEILKEPSKEELSKELGLENAKQLEEKVEDQLKKDHESLSRQHLKRQILDKLSAEHTFDVPQGMVDLELKTILEEEEREKKASFSEKEKEKFEKEYKDISARRVRLGLLLADIGMRNNISVTQQELAKAVYEQARRYPGQEKQVLEYYQNNSQATAALQAPIFEEKVIDFIIGNSKIKEKEITYKDLISIVTEDEVEEGETEKKKGKSSSKKS